MTPAPTDSETDAEIRKRIVAAARARFVSTGFSTVTMDDISRALGMSKKTLYRHFSSKEELLRETSRQNCAECEAEMEAISSADPDFFARARATFSFVSRLYATLTPAYMNDLRRNAPDVWAEIQEFRRARVSRHMRELLDQGVAQGVLRGDLDREVLVRLYLTMTSALLTPEISGWAAGEGIDKIFDAFVRVYFEGLITDAGRKRLKCGERGER
jgi:AcrR family transcriptional regulator